MMRLKNNLIMVLSTVLLTGYAMQSQAATTPKTLEELKLDLGTHVSGPKVTASDLKGRPVVIDLWGVPCKPCVKALPHLSELADLYGDKIAFIGIEDWPSKSVPKVKSVWEKRVSSKQIALYDGSTMGSFKTSSYPFVMIYDAEGKLAYSGSPHGMDSVLEEMASALAEVEQAKKDAEPVVPVIPEIALEENRSETIRVVVARLQAEDWTAALVKIRNAKVEEKQMAGDDLVALHALDKFLMEEVLEPKVAWIEKILQKGDYYEVFRQMNRLRQKVSTHAGVLQPRIEAINATIQSKEGRKVVQLGRDCNRAIQKAEKEDPKKLTLLKEFAKENADNLYGRKAQEALDAIKQRIAERKEKEKEGKEK